MRAKANQTAREEAFNAAMEQLLAHGPITKPVMIHHTWYMARDEREGMRGVPRRYRPLDEGNAIGALKATVDGIVEAGLIPADSHQWVKWGNGLLFRAQKDHGGRCGVELVLEVIE